MCEFCTSDNTKLELECVGDYAHVKLESCINFLGDSVHCLAVEEAEGYMLEKYGEQPKIKDFEGEQ
ncbi:hypothetical protein KCT83_001947 [Listeria monocytogenes]|nr:hypothetical protein [Listeria monocytogenes serotype 1/2b]EAE6112683.1 hypothetical protein [Listeria monocytogenes serotype 1/2b]EHK9369372.1 hypothetical protein [Listeria monocytogenes]